MAQAEGQATITLYHASAWDSRVSRYYGFSVCTLYLCDYMETFADEVECMWKGNGNRWNLARVLFFLCRYITMAQIPLMLSVFTPGLSGQPCHLLHAAIPIVTWIGEALPIAILLLCLYALFESKRRYMPAFLGSYILVMSALLGTTIVYVANMTLPDSRLPSIPGITCYTANTPLGRRSMLANRIMRTSSQLIMLVLALWKGCDWARRLKSPLMKAVHQGGMAYYGGVFAVSVADIVAQNYSRSDPAQLKILSYLGRWVAPILANRLLLRMYKSLGKGIETPTGRSLSGIRFAPEIGPPLAGQDSEGDVRHVHIRFGKESWEEGRESLQSTVCR